MLDRLNSSLMVFLLATYTAENGLEWFYDKSAITFAELDKCRRLLGPLPNFDSGDRGYEGVAAVGRRIYLIRCARAKMWDFKGRDAVYLTVTWLDRDKVGDFDLDAILASDGMCTQSHDHKHSFELAVADTHGDGGIAAGVDLSRAGEENVFIRRDIGEPKPTIRIEKKGESKVTEAEKFFEHGDKAVQDANDGIESPVATYGQTQTIEFSIVARVLGVILFVALVLLGTYLANFAGQILLGYIVGFAGFGLLRVLWHVKR